MDRPPLAHARSYALALVCALLAILSKPSTVMLPVVLALCVWWQHRRLMWRDLGALVPFFVFSAVAAAWTIWEQRVNSGAAGAEWSQTWPERFAIAGRVVWFYLGKLAWPADLIFIYPRWQIDTAQPLAFAPLVAMLAVVGAVVVARQRATPGVYRGDLFRRVALSGARILQRLLFRYSFVGDHFQYLASMGPLALVGAGLAVGLERMSPAGGWAYNLRGIVPVVVLAALGVMTWRETGQYLNKEALWRTTLARNPDAFMAWANLGDTLAQQGRQHEAILAFRRGLQLRPDDPPVHNDLGCALVAIGQPQAAIPILERALQLRPGYGEVHNNLGNAFSRVGRGDDAIRHYEEAIRLKPAYFEALDNLGCELVLKGRLPEAIVRFEEVIRLSPDSVKYRRNLGAALTRAGRLPEAIVQFEHVARLDPATPASHAVLGNALAAAGRWDEALARFQSALRLAPNDADLHGNVGVALGTLGKYPEAVVALQAAIRLRPDLIAAHNNLAQILRSLGKNLEAAHHYDEAERLRQQASRPR